METKREKNYLYLDKIDFKSKIMTRNKEGHYIMRVNLSRRYKTINIHMHPTLEYPNILSKY